MAGDNEPIARLKHPAVVEARRALGQVGREHPSAFLADGIKLASQALAAGAPIDGMFFLHPLSGEPYEALRQAAGRAGIDCHVVSRGVFFRMLGLGYETSARVIAVVRRRLLDPEDVPTSEGACLLVGEGIRDPRNVGVLVRTADASGLERVVFSADSADPFCRASVRSTTGSIFRVPLSIVADVASYACALRAAGFTVVGGTVRAQTACWEVDLRGRCALLVGTESSGLSASALAACDRLVRVPMTGGAHSLNVTVAAGIMLYERARQMHTCAQGPAVGM